MSMEAATPAAGFMTLGIGVGLFIGFSALCICVAVAVARHRRRERRKKMRARGQARATVLGRIAARREDDEDNEDEEVAEVVVTANGSMPQLFTNRSEAASSAGTLVTRDGDPQVPAATAGSFDDGVVEALYRGHGARGSPASLAEDDAVRALYASKSTQHIAPDAVGRRGSGPVPAWQERRGSFGFVDGAERRRSHYRSVADADALVAATFVDATADDDTDGVGHPLSYADTTAGASHNLPRTPNDWATILPVPTGSPTGTGTSRSRRGSSGSSRGSSRGYPPTPPLSAPAPAPAPTPTPVAQHPLPSPRASPAVAPDEDGDGDDDYDVTAPAGGAGLTMPVTSPRVVRGGGHSAPGRFTNPHISPASRAALRAASIATLSGAVVVDGGSRAAAAPPTPAPDDDDGDDSPAHIVDLTATPRTMSRLLALRQPASAVPGVPTEAHTTATGPEAAIPEWSLRPRRSFVGSSAGGSAVPVADHRLASAGSAAVSGSSFRDPTTRRLSAGDASMVAPDGGDSAAAAAGGMPRTATAAALRAVASRRGSALAAPVPGTGGWGTPPLPPPRHIDHGHEGSAGAPHDDGGVEEVAPARGLRGGRRSFIAPNPLGRTPSVMYGRPDAIEAMLAADAAATAAAAPSGGGGVPSRHPSPRLPVVGAPGAAGSAAHPPYRGPSRF